MPDIFYLISKWWKQMLAVLLLSLLTAAIITFFMPKKYLSITTAVPASAMSADKSKIFNQNIEALYSSLGLPEDLDVIVGTAQLDTIYLAVTDQFNLYDHYKVGGNDEKGRTTAAMFLKKFSKVIKTEYGELKIKVWDTDRNLAPQLANALMDKLQSIHQDIQNENNAETLGGLKAGIQNIEDSLSKIKNGSSDTSGYSILMHQLQNYQQLIGEYQLMVDSKPQSLLIVEKARAAIWPDKPRWWEIMIITAVLSLLFAFLLALLLERRKISRQ